jgi:hypothetical protein
LLDAQEIGSGAKHLGKGDVVRALVEIDCVSYRVVQHHFCRAAKPTRAIHAAEEHVRTGYLNIHFDPVDIAERLERAGERRHDGHASL